MKGSPLEVSSADPFRIRAELANAPRPRPGQRSQIAEFYSGRSVLITGASGFVGKVLIEKLLRACPTINRIFVLIRPKWNKKPHERLRELLESPLFDGVRGNSSVQLEESVVLVEGDVMHPNLGLNSFDLSRITAEVSVIFHSAATVKFDEPLKLSVGINIAGTKNMVALCRCCPQLAALVHVSTAYANCERDAIDEHIYPVDMDPEKLVEMADWLDQETLQELKGCLLGRKPNTYTYTKALAEWLLVKSARDLPVVICRPSIVVASASEPFKGWIDNLNGPTGVVLGAGKGLIRSMYAEKDFVADLVPVDKVINLIVTLGWFADLNNRRHGHSTSSLVVENLTDSLLLGSSSTSSGAGSSAASTSGDFPDEHHQIHHLHTGRSHEEVDDCGDLSLSTSETSSQNDASSEVDGTNEQNLSQVEEEEEQEEQVAKQASKIVQVEEEEDLFQQQDDGYGSRSPEYANSISSSSSESGSSASTQRRRRFHATEHDKQKQPSIKITTTNTNESTTTNNTTSRSGNSSIIDNVPNSLGDSNKSSELDIKLKHFAQRRRDRLVEKELPEELADIPVFHCTSGSENPITWGQVQMLIIAALAVFPSISTYRYPCGSFTNNTKLDYFYRLTLHYFPGYVVDFITRLLGGKPVMIKIFRKFDKAANVLKAFTSKQWRFDYENRLYLMEELMSEEDRRLFDCDIKLLDWRQFCLDYVMGVRKFLLKEPLDNLAQARKNLRFVYYRNLSFQVAFFASSAYWLASTFGLLSV